MSATEELRAMLDERGVEWNGDSYGFCEEVTSFDVDRLDCAFSEFDKWSTMFRVWNITPAQVVEATLGNDPLTAEVVEKIVDRNCEWYEGGDIDAQAIADELNAVLGASSGRGECHMQLRDDIRGHAYQDAYECSECGEQVIRETYMGESEPPRYCPNCGRKVVQQ